MFLFSGNKLTDVFLFLTLHVNELRRAVIQ